MEQHHRILGIDYGSTRIGLSLSDPLQILAQPFATIANDETAIDTIAGIARAESVILVVVGMPLNLKGEKGKKAQEVERFMNKLKRSIKEEVIAWDERFTTTMAHQTMRAMGTKKKERETDRGRIDAMAASLLLQSFLDSRKRSLSC